MGKSKKPDPSLRGKKPINKAFATASSLRKNRPAVTRNPSHIKNKLKRAEVYGRYLEERRRKKRELRLKREKDAEALGEEEANARKQKPRTLESAREEEPTRVDGADDEVAEDEAEDEFACYFDDTVRPKVMVTTRVKPSKETFHFISDLMNFIPRTYYYPRKKYSVKEICEFASNRDFTHLIVLSEKAKKCNGMTVSHLRPTAAASGGGWGVPGAGGGVEGEEEDVKEEDDVEGEGDGAEAEKDGDGDGEVDKSQWRGGPTAFFKVSNVVLSSDVPTAGNPTSHIPELVLNGFTTRLGHRAGRFLGSLFPHNAQFRGRQVATFHCQRDYIFARHHRYVFEEGREVDKERGHRKTTARLQELGPRFTLKMRWMQEGTFDTQFGEYEWYHKRKEMDVTRRKFHL